MQSVAASTGAPYPNDEGIERRRHPRVRYDTTDDELSRSEPREERRQPERRTVEDMRTDLQRAFAKPAPSPRQVGLGGLGGLGRLTFKPARLALVLVALVSGALAAYLTLGQSEPARQVVVEAAPEVIKEPRLQVLVAKERIGIGQRLLPSSIGWEEWPQGAVLSDYITVESEPEAVETLSEAVARFEFFPGDPIRGQKLVRDAQGYLAAVLEGGKRAVSVSVSAEAASGGFIAPKDHVDVVLTHSSAGRGATETIVRNVRVLAINSRLGAAGEPEIENETFDEAIATLELDSAEAEVVIGATALGNLSLVLRAMTDFDEAGKAEDRGTNQAIRMSSPFWTTGGGVEPR